MSAGRRLPLAVAEGIAGEIVNLLGPSCEKLEIAGSIRRRCSTVGDVELLVVPSFVEGPRVDLFAPPARVSQLDGTLATLERVLAPHPSAPANGERYKKRVHVRSGMQVDLFVVLPPAQWGPLLAIRTGPADYSRDLVTSLYRFGYRCSDGQVLRVDTGARVECESEAAFFAFAGRSWAAPEDRR